MLASSNTSMRNPYKNDNLWMLNNMVDQISGNDVLTSQNEVNWFFFSMPIFTTIFSEIGFNLVVSKYIGFSWED